MEYAWEMIGQHYLECKRMVQSMETELSGLPKGNLTYRTSKGHRYCYLQFRDKKGVHNKVVHVQEIAILQRQMERREILKKNIGIYQSHINFIEKKYPWLSTLEEAKETKDFQKAYCTMKGEFVRSKSEVIIANLLYANHIAYDYEKPLKLKGFPLPILPDFTIYPSQGGKVVYWEHFGLMSNEEYRNKWAWKMRLYEEEGISVWQKNLITTYECEAGDLNMGEIRQHIADLCGGCLQK